MPICSLKGFVLLLSCGNHSVLLNKIRETENDNKIIIEIFKYLYSLRPQGKEPQLNPYRDSHIFYRDPFSCSPLSNRIIVGTCDHDWNRIFGHEQQITRTLVAVASSLVKAKK